jgi:hypothetical protein
MTFTRRPSAVAALILAAIAIPVMATPANAWSENNCRMKCRLVSEPGRVEACIQRTPCAKYIGQYEESARVVQLSAALANARKRDRAGRLARMGPAGICARRIGRPNARGGYSYTAGQVPAFNACVTSVLAGR